MFCPKCGNKLNDSDSFCSTCGANIDEIKLQQKVVETTNSNNQHNNNLTMTEKLANKSGNIKNNIIKKIITFIKKYKKQEIIGLSILMIIIISISLYSKIYGFESLKWDKTYKDFSLNYVTQANVELGILFSGNKNDKQLAYSTSCGKIENDGLRINWDLTKNLGKCSITVKYKMKRISKEYTVISADENLKELSLTYSINPDSDEDLDLDGLTNKEEKNYKTDPQLYDTDLDGLDDKYEIFTIKTDPNKKDTDNDGLSDYNEVELGYNPLKVDSKNDGIKDGDRKNSFLINNSELGINLKIVGKGDIATTTINKFTNYTFKHIKGLMNEMYNFYTDGSFEKATVKIKYSLDDIKLSGLNEDNLTLFHFNDSTKELEKVSTTIDKDNKTLTATLNYFSKIIIGDSKIAVTNQETRLMFVIDNSVSMYNQKQMADAGYSGSNGAIGNDVSFKRVTLTNNIIDMFTGNYKFGISEFSGNYVNLNKFTDAKEVSKKSINSIRNNWRSNGNGTNIVEALKNGIKEFSSGEEINYLILLTDGKNNKGSLKDNTSSIISLAKNNNVNICIIGLGSTVDTSLLQNIADNSGCSYYSASNDSALDEIYSIIGSRINYNLVDTDEDREVEGTVIADSGFRVTRNGFSFANYGTNLSSGGHCYGMANFAQLYYNKKLPLKLGSKTTEDCKSYSYNLNDTYFSNYSDLYDYYLKTNSLKYTFGFGTFKEKQPTDYRTLKDDVLVINSQYRSEISNSKLYDLIITKTEINKEQQLKKWGVNYKKFENALLNEDYMQESKTINKADKELINAIYALHIKQDVDNNYYSATNFAFWAKKVLKIEQAKKIDSNAFISVLEKRLASGDAPVIFSNFTNGGHAINAIDLVQDKNNGNYYYIGVYDNNFPGRKRYVDIECTKDICVTRANKYYPRSEQPIGITMSLKSDLEYFK